MPLPYPKKWALLVGVGRYDHYAHLQFATRDVVEIGKLLRNEQSFGEVMEFHDEGTAPERDAILHCVGELAGKLQEDDLLLFYFSGHGGIERREGKDHLLPRHASPAALRTTGLKVEDIVEGLRDTGCKNVALFIDACRDAPGDKGSKGAKTIAASMGENTRAVVEEAGFVTFFSCKPEDRSWEIEDLKHGSFTYCLLQAVREQSLSTVKELDGHLSTSVPLLNSKHRMPPQQPYVIASVEQQSLPLFEFETSGTPGGAERLIHFLAARYASRELEARHYEHAVQALLRAAPFDQATTQRLRVIADYADGHLGPVAFAAAWDAIDRLTLKSDLGTRPERIQ